LLNVSRQPAVVTESRHRYRRFKRFKIPWEN
jgi:hypothetical protein